MMKLLKYDLKRNAATFLSLGAILILLQLILSITGHVREWSDPVILGFTAILYSFAVMFSVIVVVTTYRKNIKAYSRRLLPKRNISTIGSIMFLSWIVFFVIMGVIILHLVLFDYFIGIQVFQIVDLGGFADGMLLLFQLFWGYTFIIIIILLSNTISASIRGRLGRWAGIISFFVLQGGLGWIESEVLHLRDSTGVSMIVLKETENVEISTLFNSGQLAIDWSSIAIEVTFMAIMVYAMVLLLNRREQT